MRNSGFLTEDEKLKFYANDNGIDMRECPELIKLKVFRGAEFLVYGFDKEEGLKIHTSFIVTGISADDDKGVTVTFMDKKSYQQFKLDSRPRRLGEYTPLVHVPTNTWIERTVKTVKYGPKKEGLATLVCCHLQSLQTKRIPGHTYVIPQQLVLQYLAEDELQEAEEGLS